MRKITLDEMIEEVQAKEALIQESTETQQMLNAVSKEIIDAALSGKATVLTDYDADGITAGYIMRQTLLSINPECDISVKCNDRRGSYGLKAFLAGEEKAEGRYIICDMGSNELEAARDCFGENAIIVDHHIVESQDVKNLFKSNEGYNACLCNLHAINKDDSLNAQYCTAGLAYRIYQISKENLGEKFKSTAMQDNTVSAMACIGTAADMVDVLDINSYNRQILKNGIECINNADETNFDFVIGNILARNSISENTTAHQLAFNVGAFINSASRMSDITQENGAQKMFDVLLSNPESSKTYRMLDEFEVRNRERKDFVAQLVCEDEYVQFVESHRFGENKDDNIAVYQLPDDVPAAFAGLIANKLTEACDKAVICLTYNTQKGYYTGSGRNVPTNKTSLMDFMEIATLKTEKNAGMKIHFGGHADAIGISSLNDIISFKNSVERNKFEMVRKDNSDLTILDISPNKIGTDETLRKALMLEPIGTGLSIPPVLLEGKELRRNVNFVSGRKDWKRVQVKADKETLSVVDWSYSPLSYPTSGKKNDEIALIAEFAVSDFRGQHIELTSKFNRGFLEERNKEINKDSFKKTERI